MIDHMYKISLPVIMFFWTFTDRRAVMCIILCYLQPARHLLYCLQNGYNENMETFS